MKKKVYSPLSVIFFIFVISYCSLEETNNRTVIGGKYYKFEVATTTQSKEKESNITLMPINEKEFDNLDYGFFGPIEWQQQDFLEIAYHVIDATNNDETENWKIDHASFNLPCDDSSHGPQAANLSFIKINTDKVIIERQITILPSVRAIMVWDFSSPLNSTWKPIDLTKANISAEEALLIAENNGGQEKRIEIGNDCEISLILSSAKQKDLWRITYHGDIDFHVVIDSQNGDIIN